MALPTSGNPIKFSQVNDELSNGTTDSLSLRTASAAFSLSTPDSISEMFGLSATNTTWGTLNNFSVYVEATNNSDQGTSTLQTITLADGSGDTSISCQQPSNGNIELKVAASTSGDPCNGVPSANGTDNGGTYLHKDSSNVQEVNTVPNPTLQVDLIEFCLAIFSSSVIPE